jgi:hypothetical protein
MSGDKVVHPSPGTVIPIGGPGAGGVVVDPTPEGAELTGVGTGSPVARIGVFGSSSTNVGVYAHSDSFVGLFASGGRLAGLFQGNVNITGNLTIQGVSIQAWLQRIVQLEQEIAALQEQVAALLPAKTTPPQPPHAHGKGPGH